MENQLETDMQHEMETGGIEWVIGIVANVMVLNTSYNYGTGYLLQ